MTRTTLTIIAGLAFLPLTVSAQPGQANAILREQIQALRASGFSGMTDIQVPQAPAAVQVTPASVQGDETTEALAALRRESKQDTTVSGEVARALGFAFIGESFPAKWITSPKEADVIRIFTVTTVRGASDIILGEVRKVGERKEIRSYLISTNGTLEAATVTVKVNGKLQSEKVPVANAQAGCRELLGYWTRYYRENLKKP